MSPRLLIANTSFGQSLPEPLAHVCSSGVVNWVKPWVSASDSKLDSLWEHDPWTNPWLTTAITYLLLADLGFNHVCVDGQPSYIQATL